MSKLVPSEEERADTSDVLDATIKAVTEGLTGLAASDRRQILLSIGHILQRIRGRKLLGAIRDEWKGYRERGRIKEDYVQSEQHQECLQELLDFLDQESPDQHRFEALKAIFLAAACEKQSTRESIIPQQYMRLVRTLSAGEVVVLATVYEIAKSGAYDRPAHGEEHAPKWLQVVAEKSGLGSQELVANYEDGLIEKRLLTKRRHSDRSGVLLGEYFRLTNLGLSLCRFIEAADSGAVS